MPLQETEEEEFPFAYRDVFDAAAAAVSALKRFRLERSSKDSGRISGKVGSIWWTGVQMIDIVVSEISPGQTVVSVTSNRETVNRILDSIEEILGRKFPEQDAEQAQTQGNAAEYRLREELKPLEQLLAAGTITKQEFEDTKSRIFREAGGVSCPRCGAALPVPIPAFCMGCGLRLASPPAQPDKL